MTEQRGDWSNPTRRRDEHYEAKMQELFAPEQEKPKTNGASHPLKDDTTIVLPKAVRPGSPGPGASATDPPAGSPGGGAEPAPEGSRWRQILPVVFIGLAALVVLLIGYRFIFGGGGGADEAAEGQGKDPGAAQPISLGGLQAKETNLVFDKPIEGAGDAYSIGLGEYEWEWTKKLNGDVEEVVVEGRTAANFTTAVRLTHGEITTGVFGRAEPDKPMWHATFQRTTTNGEESTNGTYQAVDEGQVILEGAYFDRVVEDNPDDEPDVIVRTYVEGDPRKEGEDLTRYARTYRAPEGTLVPWMPGWEEPDPVPETAP